jgi:ATP-dependent RNA helicase RhlE
LSTEISFASLLLAEPLLRAIEEEGYTVPTPIQAQAIPHVLAGSDLMAAAQTGTGKTAGFTLPILQRLITHPLTQQKPGTPRVLILTPTRELAAQVQESVRTYGKHARVSSFVMFGGVNINPQISAMRQRLDVLVATPGRLLDHVQQRTLDLSAVEVFVLDEADRMLDMGFIRDIRKVLALLPKQRQNLLFSATFSEEIRLLARGVLNNPIEVSVSPRNTTAERVEQIVHMVPQAHKRDVLSHIIRESGWSLPAPSTVPTGWLKNSLKTGFRPLPFMATKAKRLEPKPLRVSSQASFRFLWPRILRLEAWTLTSCHRWSILNCPTCQKTTFTASVAPVVPVPRATPCLWLTLTK